MPDSSWFLSAGKEEWDYEFAWNGVPAARFHVSVVAEKGRAGVIRIDYRGGVVGQVEGLWPYRMHGVSYVDAKTLLPRLSVCLSGDGKRRKHCVLDFDRTCGVACAVIYKSKKGKFSTRRLKFAQGLDIPSALLFVRRLDWRSEDVKTLEVLSEDEVYGVELRPLAREKIALGIGEFDAVAMDVTLRNLSEDAERGRESAPECGKARVWLSDDRRRLPLRIECAMLVGRIHGELIRVTGNQQ